jgi:protein-disulfide isomerase
MSKLNASTLFTGLSLLALLFLALTLWLVRTSWLDAFLQPSQLSSTTINAKPGIVFDDPLITTVPTDQQSSEQKTKVFVSSLDPMRGESTAKVYVILYGSVFDADMVTYLALIEDLDAAYDESVSFVWKDNPFTEAETVAATAAHCANEYGKFWEFANALSQRTDDSTDAIVTVAASLSIDGQALRDCMATSGYDGQVRQSQALAANLGVTNGHSLFINDRLFTDPIDQATIKTTIDEILANY